MNAGGWFLALSAVGVCVDFWFGLGGRVSVGRLRAVFFVLWCSAAEEFAAWKKTKGNERHL